MRRGWFLAILLGIFALPRVVTANPMDLTLSRLYDEAACTSDALSGPNSSSVCADQTAFRELMRELGAALAPSLLAPAETLGYAGFYLGLEGVIATINADPDDRDNVWARATEDQNPDKVLFISSFHVRKGLPFSFELGTSISYVAATEQTLLGADIRWALLEGYRTGWKAYFPDISVRGSVNRLMGDGELDLTVWGVDAALSHPFSISGMMTITPYIGYQFFQTIADTALVANGMEEPGTTTTLLECTDPTPGDPWDQGDYQRECIGEVPDAPPGERRATRSIRYLDFDREYIERHRGFVGVRFIYEHLSSILQYSVTDGQHTFALSLGLDY